jgi:hypothetical protein
MYLFDFDSWVWKNQRRTIQKTGKNSTWYNLISALLSPILNKICEKLSWIYSQVWLYSATGIGIDEWGRVYKISRTTGESDIFYKYRISIWLSILNGAISISIKKSAILSVIKAYTGIDADVRFINCYEIGMQIGDEIGACMMSTDYHLFHYRVYISGVTIDSALLESILNILDSSNVGGNTWEIWIEKPLFQNGFERDVRLDLEIDDLNFRYYEIRN